MACPFPHTGREKFWLGLGSIGGALFTYLAVRQQKLQSQATTPEHEADNGTVLKEELTRLTAEVARLNVEAAGKSRQDDPLECESKVMPVDQASVVEVHPPYTGPRRICVFGSSSKLTPEPYIQAATVVGEGIAKRGFVCVTGGGKTGVMGAVNKAVRACGGKTIGVIHSMWIGEEKFDELDTCIVADGEWGLHQRKELLMRNSDALIAMPGGTGTLEELLEAMSMRQLDLEGFRNQMPVCIVNVEGYYDGLVQQMERAKHDKLLPTWLTDVNQVVRVVQQPEEALAYCAHFLDQMHAKA